MLAFNRAIVAVPLPSSNIILGFVFGDDFVQTGIANTQTALSLPLSFLQERTTSNTATVTKMDTWRKYREGSLLPTLPEH